MFDNERTWAVKRLLFEFVKSPSLKHIRDEHSINKLAHDIVQRLDRGSPIWTKWNQHREQVVKGAVGCWVPISDLRKFLNGMPGPSLTETDVAQRLRAFEEELSEYPNDELKDACLALYKAEQNEGTELPAIVGRLREFIESEAARLYEERQIAWRNAQAEAQLAQEQRLLSGADCKWTQIRGSRHWYYRLNGRTYRFSPLEDRTWQLFRVGQVDDSEKGTILGRYRGRGEATKAISEMAYKPEPRY
jgi:hypothetical protein